MSYSGITSRSILFRRPLSYRSGFEVLKLSILMFGMALAQGIGKLHAVISALARA